MKTLVRVLMAAMLSVMLMAGSAMSDQTLIQSPSDDLPYYAQNINLDGFGGILDRLYGWENLERISDDTDSFFTSTPTNYFTGMKAVAKYANYGHEVGYSIDSNKNGDYTDDISMLFDLPNNDYLGGSLINNFESTASAFKPLNIDPTKEVKMVLFLDPYNSGSGDVGTINAPMWSSDASLNSDSRDHMVTYRITGNAGGYTNNNIGNYVVAWEDNWAYNSVRPSDWDYNDVVLELDPTPEPATLILLGFGLIGVVALRKKFNK